MIFLLDLRFYSKSPLEHRQTRKSNILVECEAGSRRNICFAVNSKALSRIISTILKANTFQFISEKMKILSKSLLFRQTLIASISTNFLSFSLISLIDEQSPKKSVSLSAFPLEALPLSNQRNRNAKPTFATERNPQEVKNKT